MTALPTVTAQIPLPVGSYDPSVLGTSEGTLQFLLAGQGTATASYLPGYAEYADITYSANQLNPQTGYFYAAVTLSAGVQYDFDIYTYDYSYRQGATALVPYLDLYDSAGNLLTTTPWTTDGGRYAGIAFTAATTATYYVQVAFTGTQADEYLYFDLRAAASSTGTGPIVPTGPGPVIAPQSTSIQATSYQSFSTSALFTASDSDVGGSITQYEFNVDNTAGGSGRFENNGYGQVDGTPFIVTSGDLANILYVAGYGADTIAVRAGDGTAADPHWGAWAYITITAPTLAPPTVTAPSVTLSHGTTSEAFASLFTVTDPNGVATTNLNYDISYSGTGGTLELAGVAQPKGSVLSMNDSSSGSNIFAGLSSLTYVPSAAGGTDTITLTVLDGYSAGTTVTFTVTAPSSTIAAPKLATKSTTLSGSAFFATFSSLFTATDPNGVSPSDLTYTLSYSGSGGTLDLDGSSPETRGTNLTFSASQLSTLGYTPSLYGGVDQFTLTVSDGLETSAKSTFTITSPSAPGPTINPRDSGTVSATDGQAVTPSELFTVGENYSGATPVQYQFDGEVSTSGTTNLSEIEVGGAYTLNNTIVTISASQLSAVEFFAISGNQLVFFRANDGAVANPHWGAWGSIKIQAPVAYAPVLSVKSITLSGATDSLAQALSVNVTDQNGFDRANFTYLLNVSGTAGTVELNGTPVGEGINGSTISAADFPSLTYQPSLYGGTEHLTLVVWDTDLLSNTVNFTIASPSSPGPVFTAVSATVSVERDQITSNLIPTLWTETDAYPNATVAQYEFFVGNASSGVGSLVLNGSAVANGTPMVVSAANLDTVSYQGISGSETVYVRANDGTAANPHWGAWAGVTVTAPAVTKGAVFTPTSASVPATRDEVFSTTDASSPLSLFSATDAAGGTIMQYEFYDNDTSGGLGNFLLNGTALKNDTLQLVSAGNLNTLSYMAIAGTQIIVIRANDGTAAHPVWGAWGGITVTAAVAAFTPASVTVTATRDQIYSTTGASNPLSLFSLTGVSSDAILQYEFFDNDTGGGLGNLLMNGKLLANDAVQLVGAGSLDALTYEAIAGSQVIAVRANDGTLAHPVWGAWVSVTVTAPSATLGVAFTPTSATITPQRNTIYTTTDASNPLTLFSVADTTGGTILQYEFYVNDKAGGVGYLLTSKGGLPNDTVELVSAANLGAISYKAIAGTEAISIRANDGTVAHPIWGAWSTVTVTAPAEVANTITPVTLFVTPTTAASGPIKIGSTLVQNVSGPNQPIGYEFDYASQASGDPLIPVTLQYNGAANGLFYTTDLSNVTLISTVLSGKPDTTVAIIDVRVFDGAAWSNWAADKITLVPIGTTITTSFPTPLTSAAQSVVSPASLLSSAGQQPSALLAFTHH